MSVKKDNIQGDTFSRGFPKFDETFYFFEITDAKAGQKQFHELLPEMAKKDSNMISTLEKVLADWKEVDDDKVKRKAAADKRADDLRAAGQTVIEEANPDFRKNSLPKSNALIAFSMAGLNKVSYVAIGMLKSTVLTGNRFKDS